MADGNVVRLGSIVGWRFRCAARTNKGPYSKETYRFLLALPHWNQAPVGQARSAEAILDNLQVFGKATLDLLLWTKQMAGEYVTAEIGSALLTPYDFALPAKAGSSVSLRRSSSLSSCGTAESSEQSERSLAATRSTSEESCAGDDGGLPLSLHQPPTDGGGVLGGASAVVGGPSPPQTPQLQPPKRVLDSVVAQQMNMEVEQNLLSPVSIKYKRDKVRACVHACMRCMSTFLALSYATISMFAIAIAFLVRLHVSSVLLCRRRASTRC